RIVHFRSTGDGRPDTIRRALYRKIMRRLADKHATAIVAVSRAAMEHAWGARWQRDPRARVIYNGLDLTPFRDLPADTAEVRSELGVPRDGLLAINVGRIDPPKAHDVLLEAAAQVIRQESRLHLLIVGDGSLRQEMQRKARDLNIHKNVHFLGIRDDVPRLLIASDCFVLSSRREGLPGALLEAIAARLPVVAIDLPGIREVAEHTKLITMVPVEDPSALASALLGTLKQTGDRSAVPTPFPSVFDLQSCADNVHGMYLRALDREQTV
ncbi:MAG: glycosyltransferase, partial [Phycisphaerae bacterium]